MTYGGEEGEAFSLLAPVAGTIKQARVKGSEIVMRSMLSMAAASRAEKSEAAFVRSTKHLVENMKESITKKLEIEAIYGRQGLAKVASVSSNTVTIQTAEYAAGIWVGSENMRLDFYDGSTLRGSASVVSVDIEAKTVTVDTLPAGVANGDDIFEKGAFGKEFVGIHAILSNSGTLFDISATQYNQWKSTSFAVGGALTLEKIIKGLGQGCNKGLDDDVKLYTSHAAWTKLATDQAALRRYDAKYSTKAENGFEAITFHYQGGMVEIIPHSCVKEGFAYGLVLSEFEKVGSTDVTFKIPGMNDEQYFRLLDDAHGYELRCHADVAIICHRPNKQVLFTGIVTA